MLESARFVQKIVLTNAVLALNFLKKRVTIQHCRCIQLPMHSAADELYSASGSNAQHNEFLASTPIVQGAAYRPFLSKTLLTE